MISLTTVKFFEKKIERLLIQLYIVCVSLGNERINKKKPHELLNVINR